MSQHVPYPIEIIVGDDLSTDGSRDLLLEYSEAYPDVFVLNFQPKNVGLGVNWATTTMKARGKYLAFLDDDDYWIGDDRLARMIAYLDGNEEYGVAHSAVYNLMDGRYVFEKKGFKNREIGVLDGLMNGTYNICYSSSIIRKEVMDRYIDLNDYVKYNFPIQDWPTFSLLSKHTKFYYDSVPSCAYRVASGSMSRSESLEHLLQLKKKQEIMNKYVLDRIYGEGTFKKEEWNQHVASVMLSKAINLNDYNSAHSYASQLGSKNIKTLISSNRLLFWCYCNMKKVYKAVRK